MDGTIQAGSAATPTAAPFPGRVVAFRSTEDGAEAIFDVSSPEVVRELAVDFLSRMGYHCEHQDARDASEPGLAYSGTWGCGSTARRMLLGGTAKRSKYAVSIAETPWGLLFRLTSTMSGWSGGRLGRNRERRQRKELAAALQMYLRPLMADVATAARAISLTAAPPDAGPLLPAALPVVPPEPIRAAMPTAPASLHADLKRSVHTMYRRQRRPDLIAQVPEVESQDAAYERWRARQDAPGIVDQVTDRYREGLALENRGKPGKARAVYEALLTDYPDFANAACRLGYVLDLPYSTAAFELASRLDPEFELALFLTGVNLKQAGRPDAAEAAYRRVVALNPAFAAARNNLGLLLVDREDWDGAREQFQGVLAAFPEAGNARANLALVDAHVRRSSGTGRGWPKVRRT